MLGIQRLIDCMVFNATSQRYFTYIVAGSEAIYASWSSFNQNSAQYSSQVTG